MGKRFDPLDMILKSMDHPSKSLRQRILILITLVGLLVFPTGAARAETPAGQPYTFQADDTLPRLAEKFYDDWLAWPAIVAGTQAKADADPRFAGMVGPEQIAVGQRLWIPEPDQVETSVTAYLPPPADLHPLTPERLAEFETYVETTAARYEIPGAVVIVIKDNDIVLAKTLGLRQMGQPEPVTLATTFAVGSTAKAMNSMLLASLVDDGLLAWDQPVKEVWPNFTLSDAGHAGQMRVRDLLNMGSGLPRKDLVWSGAGLTAEQLMESIAVLPIYAPIGQRYYYNNQLVATGGYIGALAAGGEYGQLGPAYARQLKQRVFDPIGMDSATTSLEAVLARPNTAIPHDYTLFGQVVPTHYHVDASITPAGGVYATGLDMAKFLITQMNGGVTGAGRRVVSAENLAETHRPQTEITDDLSYGMGWFIEDYRGIKLIWHDGDVLGFKSQLTVIPEADVGLVVLTNRVLSMVFSYGLQYRLVELLYDLPPEAEETYDQMWDNFQRAIVDLRSGPSPTVDPAAVAKYLGRYTDDWWVELRGDKLFAGRGPYEWHLLQLNETDFVVNNAYGIGITLYLEAGETSGQVTMRFTLPTGETGQYELVAPAE